MFGQRNQTKNGKNKMADKEDNPEILKKGKEKKERLPREDGMADAFFMFESKHLFDEDAEEEEKENPDTYDSCDTDDLLEIGDSDSDNESDIDDTEDFLDTDDFCDYED